MSELFEEIWPASTSNRNIKNIFGVQFFQFFSKDAQNLRKSILQ